MDSEASVPNRIPTQANPRVIRRAIVDSLFACHWRGSCGCDSCSRVERGLEKVGFRVENWDLPYGLRVVRIDDSARVGNNDLLDDLLMYMLILEVWLLLEGSASALEGAKEVPMEIGNLLWDKGWAAILLAARDNWDPARSYLEQPLWIKDVRRAFIDAMAEIALPDRTLDDVDVVGWIDEEVNEPQEVLRTHVERFDKLGFKCPKIPEQVLPYLRFHGNTAQVATAAVNIDPAVGYELADDTNVSRVPADFLTRDFPNYFVSTGRLSGYSSMWGFAAQAGGIFVSVQLTIEHLNDDLERSVNRVVAAYNDLLWPLMTSLRKPVELGVVFSDYRGQAYVVVNRPMSREEIGQEDPRRDIDLTPEWSCILNLADLDEYDRNIAGERIAEAWSLANGLPNALAAIEFLRRSKGF